jgi:hypothetical protein
MVGMKLAAKLGNFCHFGKKFTNLAKNGVGESYWTMVRTIFKIYLYFDTPLVNSSDRFYEKVACKNITN